jgi:hypothetical protein
VYLARDPHRSRLRLPDMGGIANHRHPVENLLTSTPRDIDSRSNQRNPENHEHGGPQAFSVAKCRSSYECSSSSPTSSNHGFYCFLLPFGMPPNPNSRNSAGAMEWKERLVIGTGRDVPGPTRYFFSRDERDEIFFKSRPDGPGSRDSRSVSDVS